MKRNFLPLREFRDLADLNAQARTWVMEEAGVRIHGTTREQPLDRFAVERPLMRPLPTIAPDLGTWHRVVVHRDCHVQFDRRLYSVPFALVGKPLWLRATDSFVAIYEDYRLVANHLRARKVGERLTVTAHLPPEAQAFFARDRRWCIARAAEIGPATAELVERLLADRIVERLRGAQGVLRLAETYSPARLEAACVRALYHASPFFRTVKTILKGGYDAEPLPSSGQLSSAYATGARFVRDADQLFNPESHH